jgi:hypothetical protein
MSSNEIILAKAIEKSRREKWNAGSTLIADLPPK